MALAICIWRTRTTSAFAKWPQMAPSLLWLEPARRDFQETVAQPRARRGTAQTALQRTPLASCTSRTLAIAVSAWFPRPEPSQRWLAPEIRATQGTAAQL